jgi:hypothetical protein
LDFKIDLNIEFNALTEKKSRRNTQAITGSEPKFGSGNKKMLYEKENKNPKKVNKFALLSDTNGVPSHNPNAHFTGLASNMTNEELCVELLTAASIQASITKKSTMT